MLLNVDRHQASTLYDVIHWFVKDVNVNQIDTPLIFLKL